jgi:excisionase family DNA binding protein
MDWDNVQWIVGPDDNPDPEWWSYLIEPRVIQVPSKRRKMNQRRRDPVVATEPDPNRVALSVPEAAWMLHCSPNTVWNMIKAGEVQTFKVRSRRLINRAEVERIMSGEGSS